MNSKNQQQWSNFLALTCAHYICSVDWLTNPKGHESINCTIVTFWETFTADKWPSTPAVKVNSTGIQASPKLLKNYLTIIVGNRKRRNFIDDSGISSFCLVYTGVQLVYTGVNSPFSHIRKYNQSERWNYVDWTSVRQWNDVFATLCFCWVWLSILSSDSSIREITNPAFGKMQNLFWIWKTVRTCLYIN